MDNDDNEASVSAVTETSEAASPTGLSTLLETTTDPAEPKVTEPAEVPLAEQPPKGATPLEAPAEQPVDPAPAKDKRKGKRSKPEGVSEAQARAANIPAEQLGLGLFLPDVAQAAEDAKAVFAMVPLDQIEPDADNARLASGVDEDKRLMHSIAEGGLEDEIKLVPKEPGTITAEAPAKYRIKDGWRRFVAYQRLHKLTKGRAFGAIPSLIRRDQTTGAARVGAAVLNLHRSNLRPFEEARAIRKMLDENPGMTVATAAMHANMTEGVALARLRFYDVPESLARILGDGEHELGCLDVARQFLPESLRDANTEAYEKVFCLVEDIAKEPVEHAGGRVAYLGAESFEREIIRRLKHDLGAVDTSSWEYREYRDEPEWKEAVEASPRVSYKNWQGEHVLVLDPPRLEAAQVAIEQRVQQETEKLVEEEAKLPPEAREANQADRKARAEAQFDNQAARLTLEIRRSALKKALAPVTGLEPKVEKTLLALVSMHVRFGTDAADAIADICGLEVAQVLKAKDNMPAFLEGLRKKNREVFWRFVAAATAYYLHDPETPYGTGTKNSAVYELWTGSTIKEAGQAAVAELREAQRLRKQGKLKLPKATEDARLVACEETCKAKKGDWCVGDSGHRRRTFHESRLKAWAKVTGKNPVQGHVRVRPRSGARAKAAKAKGGPPSASTGGPKKP